MLPANLGTNALTRVPRIQVCRRTQPKHNQRLSRLDMQALHAFLGREMLFIPVVTFLAPLASNSEGLKDR